MGSGSYVSPHIYLLEFEGKPAGRLSSVSLPQLGGDLAVHTISGRLSKHIVQSKPDDFVFDCGVGMSRDFYDWIKQSFKSNFSRKNGSVVIVGPDQVEQYRMDFVNAIITGVSVPKLEKSSKDPVSIKVRMSSEDARILPAGKKMTANHYLNGSAWNPTAFKVSIDGLEKECKAITKIGSISVGTKLAVDYVGQSPTPTISPGSTTIGDVIISIPQSEAMGFLDWAKGIVKGDAHDAGVRHGTIEYLGPHSKDAYFILDLERIGVTSAKVEAASDNQEKTVELNLYCDSIDFSASSAAVK